MNNCNGKYINSDGNEINREKYAMLIPDISMRDYVDTKFTGLTGLFETKIMANEKAVELASRTLSARLDLMNEFRMQLRDQASTFFPRSEHEIYTRAVDKDIRELRESKVELAGKASEKSVAFTMIVAMIGIILSFAALMHSFVDAADRKQSSATISRPVK